MNPKYVQTFVFENDFPALRRDSDPSSIPSHPLLQSRNETGCCRVVCFSPRHDLTLAEMAVEEIGRVVDTWKAQVAGLKKAYRWVQIFENKGEIMGCSNPHPHGQIWAQATLPNEPMKEDREQRKHFEERHSPLLLEYADTESASRERIVAQNDDWLIVVPYWAVWPFETLVVPQRHVPHLDHLDSKSSAALASILKVILVKYDNLFNTSFPYSMGWHGAPHPVEDNPHWQLHAHFYPPLLRSASVKKFMVGYEMLCEPQRDLTAEGASERLRSVSSDSGKAA